MSCAFTLHGIVILPSSDTCFLLHNNQHASNTRGIIDVSVVETAGIFEGLIVERGIGVNNVQPQVR